MRFRILTSFATSWTDDPILWYSNLHGTWSSRWQTLRFQGRCVVSGCHLLWAANRQTSFHW